jgi:hypothetical protein
MGGLSFFGQYCSLNSCIESSDKSIPLAHRTSGAGLAGGDISSSAGERKKPPRFSADHLCRSDVGKIDMSIDVQNSITE